MSTARAARQSNELIEALLLSRNERAQVGCKPVELRVVQARPESSATIVKRLCELYGWHVSLAPGESRRAVATLRFG